MGDRWGPAGPPEEAYGRVTNPQRYAPLHTIARDVLDDLQRRFDVTAHASFDLDLNRTTQAPVITLVPSDRGSSPLSVMFTAFPGLVVGFGRTQQAPIPVYGCGACDETVEECAQSLRELVEAVTTGSFGERIVPADDGLWSELWRANESGSHSSRIRITADEVKVRRQKLGSDDARWTTWPAHRI